MPVVMKIVLSNIKDHNGNKSCFFFRVILDKAVYVCHSVCMSVCRCIVTCYV